MVPRCLKKLGDPGTRTYSGPQERRQNTLLPGRIRCSLGRFAQAPRERGTLGYLVVRRTVPQASHLKQT
jgi:hypothetical protein